LFQKSWLDPSSEAGTVDAHAAAAKRRRVRRL
jgi:hypothetical protein